MERGTHAGMERAQPAMGGPGAFVAGCTDVSLSGTSHPVESRSISSLICRLLDGCQWFTGAIKKCSATDELIADAVAGGCNADGRCLATRRQRSSKLEPLAPIDSGRRSPRSFFRLHQACLLSFALQTISSFQPPWSGAC